MSREVALDNVWLRPSARWGHTEYSLEYQLSDAIRLAEEPAGRRELYDRWRMDLLWKTHDGLHRDWDARGRTTDMGHAEYARGGTDKRALLESPFRSPEEVWAFDPVAEYGLPRREAQAQAYQGMAESARRDFPDQLTTGGYYRTIVSGAIAAFGWEMLLLAASDPSRLERVFDRFFEYTLFHMEAWARTTVEVVIQHDDFVWASGPFMHPDFYRSAIIPRYAELWRPLHSAGKKVLFCSDGDYTVFAEDLARAGADGFIFEPAVDFGWMAERFGSSHCLVGSFVDCRDLTLDHGQTVASAIDRTFAALAQCRGALLAVGNHLPPNIPPDALESYRRQLLRRLEEGR
jgi:hypothetical protein